MKIKFQHIEILARTRIQFPVISKSIVMNKA